MTIRWRHNPAPKYNRKSNIVATIGLDNVIIVNECFGARPMKTCRSDAAARSAPASDGGTRWAAGAEAQWVRGGKQPVQLHAADHPPAQGPRAVWGNQATKNRAEKQAAARSANGCNVQMNAVCRTGTFTDTCTCRTCTSRRQKTSQHSGEGGRRYKCLLSIYLSI